MVQVKIYGLKHKLDKIKFKLSDIVHSCLVECFGLPPEKKFHRFFPLEKDNFIFPASRSEDYIILEFTMFEGRQIETKKDLIRLLIKLIQENLSISANDIEIVILESARYNWGIRGFPGDELDLSYNANK